MAKRIVAFFLVAVLVVALLPVMGETVEAKAEVGQRFYQGDFYYEIIDGVPNQVKLIKLRTGLNPARLNGLYIPDSVTNPADNDEYRVTVIGEGAFWGYRDINGELRLPLYLETIESYAFADCTGLYGELYIPESCTGIENNAFIGDYHFSSLNFGESPIVTTIGAKAFANCYGMSGTFTLPASICDIGVEAFRYTGFDTFIIPVLDGALNSDTYHINGGKPWDKIINLSEVEYEIKTLVGIDINNPGYYTYISATDNNPVTVIGKGEYNAVVDIDYINSRVISDDGYIIKTSIDEDGKAWITGMLDPYKSDITIPAKVTVDSVEYDVKGIYDNAFANMPISGDLTIGNGIEIIGSNAFKSCAALNGELKLPDSLKTIKKRAFDSAGFTGDLILNEGLENVGDLAFCYCTGISGNIVLPSTLKSIGTSVFCYPNSYEKTAEDYIKISIGRNGTFVFPEELYTNGCVIANGALIEFYPYIIDNRSDFNINKAGFYYYHCKYYKRTVNDDGSVEYTSVTNLEKGVHYREKQNEDNIVDWLPDTMPCNTRADSLTKYFNELALEDRATGKFTLEDPNQIYSLGENTILLYFEPFDKTSKKPIYYQWNVSLTHLRDERYENIQPPVNVDQGEYHYHYETYDLIIFCDYCGATLNRIDSYVDDEMQEHYTYTTVTENEVSATCAKEGTYDIVKYCSCGKELSRETKTTEKLLTHVEGEPKKENEVAATCTADGSYDLVTYCTECGAELSRETKTVEKLGHIAGEAKKENEIAATCSHTGSYDMVTYCDRCGAELKRVSYITEKSAHTPGAWETVQHASYYNTGKKVRKCTVCDEVVEEEIIPILTPTPTPDPGNGKTVPGGVVDNPGGGQPIATPTLDPSPTNLPILTPKVTPVPTNKVDPVPTGKPNVSVKERTDGTIITTSTSEGKNGELITSKETVNIDGSVSEVIKVEKPDGSIEKVTKDTKADGGYIETAILKDADGSKVTLTFTSEDGKKASLSVIISSSSEVEIPAEVPGTDGKTHKITALTAGVVSDTAESVVLTDAIKVLKKNALSGLANLTSLKLSDGTKLGKNSLKGTNAKLVLKVVVSKNATKKERKAAKKSMAAQLKKAGNANAKVKIVTE